MRKTNWMQLAVALAAGATMLGSGCWFTNSWWGVAASAGIGAVVGYALNWPL